MEPSAEARTPTAVKKPSITMVTMQIPRTSDVFTLVLYHGSRSILGARNQAKRPKTRSQGKMCINLRLIRRVGEISFQKTGWSSSQRVARE
jgi:hypothetical protein